MGKMNFNTNWKSSTKPKKQVKYRFNAPAHIKGKMLRAHLSSELVKKYDKRTARVRKDDKVKIMTGQFKNKTGKVEVVDTKNFKVIIQGIGIQKTEGTKIRYPIAISNVMITELTLSDKKREVILKRK
jgi:large subunit ribosomal protein L24